MSTFVLKKYQATDVSVQEPVEKSNTDPKEENDEEVTIEVVGSISEIVAKALNKAMVNTNELEEVPEEQKVDSDVKVISTETINQDPVTALRSIKENETVYVVNEGIKTRAEEWFLLNLENKTKSILYTAESFSRYLQGKIHGNR